MSTAELGPADQIEAPAGMAERYPQDLSAEDPIRERMRPEPPPIQEPREQPTERRESEGGAGTLEFFLSSEPDVEVTRKVEIKRRGLVFTLRAIDEDQLKNCMKRSELPASRAQKRAGGTPERDFTKMHRLTVEEGTVSIQRRLRSDADAKRDGLPALAEPMSLRDPQLLARYGKVEEFLRRWFLTGELASLADEITTLSGYDAEAIVDAGN